jgi:hypothetical protein
MKPYFPPYRPWDLPLIHKPTPHKGISTNRMPAHRDDTNFLQKIVYNFGYIIWKFGTKIVKLGAIKKMIMSSESMSKCVVLVGAYFGNSLLLGCHSTHYSRCTTMVIMQF